jgi:hypothetical protein
MKTPKLLIEEGGILEGTVEMGGPAEAKARSREQAAGPEKAAPERLPAGQEGAG